MKKTIRNAKYPRRKRPEYPVLEVGQAVLGTRPECGTNIELLTLETKKRGRRVLEGQFILHRIPAVKPSRSKHQPHVGKKQQARQLFNAVTT